MDIKHYVYKIKEHESTRMSTNDRSKYWKSYMSNTAPVRQDNSFQERYHEYILRKTKEEKNYT